MTLETGDRIDRVSMHGSAEEFLALKNPYDFDVFIVDIHLPGMSGTEVCRLIKTAAPERPIIVLSNLAADSIIFEALKNGASSYVLKSDLSDLESIIDTVMDGGAVISPTIALRIGEYFRKKGETHSVQLTHREQQILSELMECKTMIAIARFLGISLATVKFHVRNIYEKLNVSNRAGMVKKASDLGLA